MLFKRRVFLDVLALSALWTIRVLAGGVAARVEVSDWLLALSVFLFVGLALLKRYADLGLLASQDTQAAPGRGYVTADRDLLRSMGVTSGYMAVLVLALYLTSPQVMRLYRVAAAALAGLSAAALLDRAHVVSGAPRRDPGRSDRRGRARSGQLCRRRADRAAVVRGDMTSARIVGPVSFRRVPRASSI